MAKNNVAAESLHVRVPVGTLQQIDAVLYGGELRAGFIRMAIAHELARRETEFEDPVRRPRRRLRSA